MFWNSNHVCIRGHPSNLSLFVCLLFLCASVCILFQTEPCMCIDSFVCNATHFNHCIHEFVHDSWSPCSSLPLDWDGFPIEQKLVWFSGVNMVDFQVWASLDLHYFGFHACRPWKLRHLPDAEKERQEHSVELWRQLCKLGSMRHLWLCACGATCILLFAPVSWIKCKPHAAMVYVGLLSFHLYHQLRKYTCQCIYFFWLSCYMVQTPDAMNPDVGYPEL